MKTKLIIDRFEGDFAVCEKEDRTMIDIPRETINEEAKEGDVLILENGEIFIDKVATEKRKAEIAELSKGLWE